MGRARHVCPSNGRVRVQFAWTKKSERDRVQPTLYTRSNVENRTARPVQTDFSLAVKRSLLSSFLRWFSHKHRRAAHSALPLPVSSPSSTPGTFAILVAAKIRSVVPARLVAPSRRSDASCFNCKYTFRIRRRWFCTLFDETDESGIMENEQQR